MKNTQPIGIFDSGIGGLTVMKQIMQKLPQEKLVYFGDTARVPYGEKSPEALLRYSIENSIFLMEHQIKLLVIACNTAAAYAVDKLRQILKIPIVDVIQAGADKAALSSANHKIGVLSTRATANSGIYQREILKRLPPAEIYSVACPLLVPLIEEHLFDHPATHLIIKDYLTPLKSKGIDTLLLGCTHYPLLSSHIQKEIGSQVLLIDSATTCAEQVEEILDFHKLRNTHEFPPIHQYFASDDPEKFRHLGANFLGKSIDRVEKPSKLKFEL